MTDQTRLLVLGLLARRPMHGYEIRKQLELGQVTSWTDVLPGSIYHALKKLSAEGLIEVKSTEKTGHRVRAVYGITPAGHTAFEALLSQAWRTVPRAFPSSLYLAMVFWQDAKRADVLQALQGLQGELERELATWQAGADVKGREARQTSEAQNIASLTFSNGLEHLQANLNLVQRLQETIAGNTVQHSSDESHPDKIEAGELAKFG